MNRRLRIAAAASAATLALGLAGCAKAMEHYNDAPRASTVNREECEVIAMPDGFSNSCTKCDHGNRIYQAFHDDGPYAAMAVVPQDPTCRP